MRRTSGGIGDVAAEAPELAGDEGAEDVLTGLEGVLADSVLAFCSSSAIAVGVPTLLGSAAVLPDSMARSFAC